MAESKPTTEVPSFGEVLTQWERDFNAMANQVMGSDGFSQAMNAAQKAQTQFQKGMVDGLSRQMETLNMPTRADVLRIAEAITRLDRRLERIEDMLGTTETAPQRPAPPRTKQPPPEYLKKATS